MSSLKRSAAEAFGSESLQPSLKYKMHDSTPGDDSQKDVQPTTTLISKIQAVELFEKLIQFLPKEYSKASAVVELNASAAKNSEIGDVRILTQFKFRYLCRRFRNIIHRQTPLTLSCFIDCNGGYGLALRDNSSIRVSRDRPLNQLAELPKRFDSAFADRSEPKAVLLTGTVCRLEIGHSYGHYTEFGHSLSIPALLYRLTDVVGDACRLSLDLKTADLKTLIKDFDLSLKRLFPSIGLEALTLRAGWLRSLRTASSLTKHLLEFGQDSLVRLSVNVYILKSVFVAENGGSPLLPDSWTCESLEELKLDLSSCERSHSFDNDASRAPLVAFGARLPRLFPNLKKIVFSRENTHVDFSILREFERLFAVRLRNYFATDYPTQEQCDSLALLSSTSVSSLSLAAMEQLLLKVDLVLPKLTTFKYVIGQRTDSFVALKRQLETVNGSFEHLRELVLKLDSHGVDLYPSYSEFLLLLRSLGSLRKLTTLRLELGFGDRDDPVWNSPDSSGRLSAIQVLPETITHAYFVFALRPTAVEYVSERHEYVLRCSAEVPHVEESVYTDWLRMLLLRTSERPRLERFFCVCVAPRFEAILALAEKWNKSSAAAIAEIALTFLVHVQCRPVYARMFETGIPARGDRMRFRFVLAPRQELTPVAPDELTQPKRRTVTVEFTNFFFC